MKLDNDWEEFRGGPTESPQSRFHITINQHGMLLMNTNCYNALGRPEAVLLFYNRARNKIAISATHRSHAHAFPVVRNGATGWRIQACTFCRHYDIRIAQAQKFIGVEIENDGMMLLDLSNTVNVARGPRPPRKPRTKPAAA